MAEPWMPETLPGPLPDLESAAADEVDELHERGEIDLAGRQGL
jgi:hypothetical protein